MGPARVLLATAHLALNEAEPALAAAEAAIAEAPEDVTAQQLRLRALFELGRFDQLGAHARQLVALADPGSEAAAQAAFWSAYAR
jgi:tetratricopeptide (TPR) repeat protein